MARRTSRAPRRPRFPAPLTSGNVLAFFTPALVHQVLLEGLPGREFVLLQVGSLALDLGLGLGFSLGVIRHSSPPPRPASRAFGLVRRLVSIQQAPIRIDSGS